MKTTLEIPDDLFREAKAKAALEGIKLKDLVARGIRHEVHGASAPEAAKANADAGQKAKPAERKRTPFPLLRPGKRPKNHGAAIGSEEIFVDDEPEEQGPVVSVHDLMKDYCGIVNSGIGDLSTNPKHMEGFGRDSMGNR